MSNDLMTRGWIPLRGGPMDGGRIEVLARREPHDLVFPAQWRDGSWDNAHWEDWYTLRGTPETGMYYEFRGRLAARGLNKQEASELDPSLVIGGLTP